MTVAELDEALYLTKGMIQREGLEKVYEVKLTLADDVLKELKARNVFCDTRERGNSSLYKNTPFEEGEETSVSIVEKRKPRYRPFKDCDELISTWQKMMGYPAKANTMPLIWVKCKISENVGCLTGFQKIAVLVCADDWRDMTEMFDDFTFLDGTPFGVAK